MAAFPGGRSATKRGCSAATINSIDKSLQVASGYLLELVRCYYRKKSRDLSMCYSNSGVFQGENDKTAPPVISQQEIRRRLEDTVE